MVEKFKLGNINSSDWSSRYNIYYVKMKQYLQLNVDKLHVSIQTL